MDRFWSKVEKSDGCWLWTAGTSGKYGSFRIDGSATTAHRVAYALEVGPVPEGLVLDHLCRNTLCVNPSHLEPVTIAENVRRGDLSGNGAEHRAKTHCPAGHEYAEANTYMYKGGRHCRACRRETVRRLRAKKVLATV